MKALLILALLMTSTPVFAGDEAIDLNGVALNMTISQVTDKLPSITEYVKSPGFYYADTTVLDTPAKFQVKFDHGKARSMSITVKTNPGDIYRAIYALFTTKFGDFACTSHYDGDNDFHCDKRIGNAQLSIITVGRGIIPNPMMIVAITQ